MNAEDEPDQRRLGSQAYFKTADIHKIHANGDAIAKHGVARQTVWLLRLGTVFAFYDKSSGFKKEPESLGETPRGVGAILGRLVRTYPPAPRKA